MIVQLCLDCNRSTPTYSAQTPLQRLPEVMQFFNQVLRKYKFCLAFDEQRIKNMHEIFTPESVEMDILMDLADEAAYEK